MCYNKNPFYLFTDLIVVILNQGKLKKVLAHAFSSPHNSLSLRVKDV